MADLTRREKNKREQSKTNKIRHNTIQSHLYKKLKLRGNSIFIFLTTTNQFTDQSTKYRKPIENESQIKIIAEIIYISFELLTLYRERCFMGWCGESECVPWGIF